MIRTLLLAAAVGAGALIAGAATASADTDTRSARSGEPQDRRAAHASTTVAQPGPRVTRSGQSPFALSSGTTRAAELSGIAYAGETGYWAVGDNGAKAIWGVYTSLNLGTGRIRSSLVTAAVEAPELGSDSEGIALRPGRGTAWVADEATSTIGEFSLSTGAKVGSVAVPAIYRPANVQGNFGLESLAFGDGSLWTANEEALKSDGPLSTTAAGSWVRIQRFSGPEFAPAAQYAYLTDPISQMSPFVAVERSGLVDLLVLPDGRLLALERELGGWLPRFRSRVYLLDLTGATDVATLPSLADGGFTPAAKTLLWQGVFGFTNFEGMTLGPRLTDGSYSLLLVSDNGNGELGQRQDVFSLILGGVSPAGVIDSPAVLV